MVSTVEVFSRPRVRKPCHRCAVPLLLLRNIQTGRMVAFVGSATIEARRWDGRMPPLREIWTIPVTDLHDCRPAERDIMPEGRERQP